MNSPQLEDGFTQVANEILEQMAKVKLSPTQYRIIFVIWRYTYGFGRKEHDLSLQFLSNATGCDKRQIQRELTRLEERNIIIQNIKNGLYRKITFNKMHKNWSDEPDKIDSKKDVGIGEINNGETDNGNSDTIGEIDNPTIGQIVNTTIGETVNQERKSLNKTLNKDIYIYDFWNSQQIIVHRKLTDPMKRTINARLKEMSEEDITSAIQNYKTIISDNRNYFFSYKWNLQDFLNPRNVERFLTENQPFENFAKRKGNVRHVEFRRSDEEYYRQLDELSL